jgi:hypothetical protein
MAETQNTTKIEPQIEPIVVPGLGTTLSFDTFEEALDWNRREQKAWQPLLTKSGIPHYGGFGAVSELIQSLTTMLHHLKQVIQVSSRHKDLSSALYRASCSNLVILLPIILTASLIAKSFLLHPLKE